MNAIPTFLPDKREILYGGADRRGSFGPLPHAKFYVYRGNVSPLRGEKPIIGLLSKNNAGTPAGKKCVAF